MRKFGIVVLAFLVTGCTLVLFPDWPSTNPPVIIEITRASATDDPSWMPAITSTPAITLTPSFTPSPYVTLTPVPSDTWEPPRVSATLIIPTLQPRLAARLSFIQMIDANVGWGLRLESRGKLRPGPRVTSLTPWHAEGYILRTTDGGITWQNVTPPNGAYSPGGFFALDANTAWASGNVPCCSDLKTTHTWRTTDGGKTWQPSQPLLIDPIPRFYLPLGMQFIDQNTGWLLAALYAENSGFMTYTLLQTTDAGETWIAINQRLNGCWPAGPVFLDLTTGWYGENCFIGGIVYQGTIETYFSTGGWQLRKTVDGGRTFDETTIVPMPPELLQSDLAGKKIRCHETRLLRVTSEVAGVEWGCNVFSRLERYRYFSFTTDAGRTWNTWRASGNEYFLNATHGWRSFPSGEFQQTTDGGLHWVTLKSVVAWETAQFDFVSEQEGWASVSTSKAIVLLHTTDGGMTWKELSSVIASP
ncbi:MAG: hypothetical protein EHM40_08210 [Chloroflexi bacterium]|nr:MAG: hypothetical protein EHM40_08210 [Chloroflexota bacterium]